MYQQLINKEYKLAVIGLGYVGLPIALEFAKKISVIGFDINAARVELTKASETIGKVIKKGDYVVYESTVYPGCTEEDCLPIIESLSGLKMCKDFKLGYSPERINPGDKEHTLAKIVKVVSGCDAESAEEIAKTYELVVTAGVHRASSIKVAEAAKIIENTQRDLNIALMNELSIIFDKMDINTYEVLEAAGTKWNFLKFQPGLVGGHCIGVDPYYLTYKSNKLGYDSRVILAGRVINDEMPYYVAKKVVQHIMRNTKDITKAKVLVKGATFKENVSDIRNSKVADVVKELRSFSLQVDVIDPHADSDELMHEYGFGLTKEPANDYDAVIITVPHNHYKDLTEDYWLSITKPGALLADLKGTYRNKISKLNYWSL
ncbi:MAG: nucleotide sugar dehydrogenase [Sphingobacteriales bacterium]|nr:nucleotide sugar dehydrogenase [Sphingobacteriales bacterium]